jgi:hypothetical protein
MKTECIRNPIEFKPLNLRKVTGAFDGQQITSDAGLLLIRQVDEKFRITEQLTTCFKDFRKQNLCSHSLLQLLKQRIYGICGGYEDLNDHDHLRQDPLFSILVDKEDPIANTAGKSTLNRIELFPKTATEAASSRYHKIVACEEEIEDLLICLFIETAPKPQGPLILDFDATDDPIHGEQEGRFFHGYYGHYCYLPLYVFCGSFLLMAKLRPSNIDAAQGTKEALEKIVKYIRQEWPDIQIIVRGDGGFCREEIMQWCEGNGVDYIFGLAKNARLINAIEQEMEKAKQQSEAAAEGVRYFKEFAYQTLKTWSRARRVIAKVEHLIQGSNPRFIVTSLKKGAQEVYEKEYCARGDMENRIKEQQLELFADRTSCHNMRANQLRLWFSSVAYILMNLLREYGLQGSSHDHAQSGTIRERLFKLGASITLSVRRVYISFSEAFVCKGLFRRVYDNLARGLP